MAEASKQEVLLREARDGLRNIGYQDDLLRERYQFTDILADAQSLCEIDLAAFAQEPPSYRNSCIGVAFPPYDTAEAILKYCSLGAPQILALHPETDKVVRWKISANGKPIFLESIESSYLRSAIQSHKADWNPAQILRAKSIRFTGETVQLDFFDLGLVPTLEKLVFEKLDRLLRDVLAVCKSTYEEYHHTSLDYQALYRLIFRLIAAKLLGDRQFPGNWLDSNVQEVLNAVEHFYFQHDPVGYVLEDIHVQEIAWRKIRTAFSLQNLSVEALAYVYENTLVSPETRKQYGTHATPPEIAEYIVQNIPFEELAKNERHVFEPFCGHAPFLTAALGRLRTLLPPEISTEQRHTYLVEMLSGMEIDVFACEIARCSLILADYPNPNGWRIENAGVFISPDLDSHLAQAQIVLCNPPFEDFTPGDRETNRSIRAANKTVEILRRVLQHPPKMLGFVLPRVFADGQSYREVRKHIASLYGNITLVELPDNAFNYSDAETVLLVAHGHSAAQRTWYSITVNKKDYQRFLQTGEPTSRVNVPTDFTEGGTKLWYGRLQPVWDALSRLPHLGDFAEIHRGIEYNASLAQYELELFSDNPRQGFARGLHNVTDEFEPYISTNFIYLDTDPRKMRGKAYLRPWSKPKVIANAARLSRGPWTIAAIVDEQGLVCYQRFHGIWSKREIPLEVITALLNSSVANAFLTTHRTSRDNKIETIKQIPIPALNNAQLHRFRALVREYMFYRQQWQTEQDNAEYLEGRCRGVLRQLDAELLAAYDLPIHLERELLRYFDGYRRPGPVNLMQVQPSTTKKLYSAIVRVEDIKGENGNKVVDAIVAGWNPYETIHFPLALLPEDVQEKLESDVLLLARVNIGAKKAEDLIFEDFELISEPESDERFA
ncbi:MAG TPA: hypothetical protein VNE61_01900 [Ktedonobacteraceae bacterium]|nr:hypothetical protein [Ktedonobacteraceae bacterium]